MSKNTENLIKLGFSLDVTEDWPPYSVEHLWAKPIVGGYAIKSFPFFVKEIAFDDEISVDLDRDGYVLSWKMIKISNNSTIWVISPEGSSVIGSLEELGCGVESDAVYNLYSINIPMYVSTGELETILDLYENDPEVAIAYPAYRR